MASRLIIHFQGNDGDLKWFIEGQELSVATSSPASLLQKSWDDFNGEVIVFVPTLDVYLTQAKLPQLSQAKLRKAIPYAIEDEVTDEVKNCHFAYTPIDHAGNTAIAVVSLERMNAWLELLPPALRHNMSFMVPEVLALPWVASSWTIAEMGDIALVRLDIFSGFAIEKQNLVDVLAQCMRDNNHKVEKVLLVTVASTGALEKEIVDRLQLPVTLISQQEAWPVFLLKNFDKDRIINFSQGDYQSHYNARGLPRLKRIFSVVVAAWLVSMMGFGLIKLSLLTYQAHKLNSQLAVVYDEIFPGEARRADPKGRIQSALALVKKARAQNIFMRLVAVASPVLVEAKGISIQGAVFSNDQLDIQLEASDFQLLDKVTTDLRAKGVSAEQSRATKIGEVTQAHLVLKENL